MREGNILWRPKVCLLYLAFCWMIRVNPKLFATKRCFKIITHHKKVLPPWSNTSSSNPTRTPALVDASLRFSFWFWLILKLFQNFILKLYVALSRFFRLTPFQDSHPETLSKCDPETLSMFWSWVCFEIHILKMFLSQDSYPETLSKSWNCMFVFQDSWDWHRTMASQVRVWSRGWIRCGWTQTLLL